MNDLPCTTKVTIEQLIELINYVDGAGVISTDDQLLIEALEGYGYGWADPSCRDDYFEEDDE